MAASTDSAGGSTKPYLLRAIYEWALDNNFTPQILVDAGARGVVAPAGYVADGRVVFTIHPQAVANLELGNDEVAFAARFSGKRFEVCVPMVAILAVYCRENGQGLFFSTDPEPAPPERAAPPAKKPSAAPPPKKSPPALRLVK